MTCASLLMIVVLGQTRQSDPTLLVSELGSARYSQREAASTELERLGRLALPALRTARDAKDPEIRSRAALLLSRIEGAILTQPSFVKLNFKDASLQEVLKTVSEQSGVRLVLRPENSPAFRQRRLSLDFPEVVTFWKALDLIADKARLQYNYGPHVSMAGREPEFPLFDGGSRPFVPSHDNGPFRVIVTGLHYQRDVNFTGAQSGNPQRFPVAPNSPGTTSTGRFPAMIQENCNAQIQIVGEPRFSIGQTGAVRITEASDDKGQSLVIPLGENPEVNSEIMQRSAGYFGYASGSVLQVQAQLVRPTSPGALIKTLKGTVPVALSTRKPSPLIATLKDAKGRTFENEEAVLTVHEVRVGTEPRHTMIEISFRPQRKSVSSTSMVGVGEVSTFNRPDLFQQQIDVVDNLGRPIMWYPSRFDGENGRITMTLAPTDPSMIPVELRCFGIARATTNVTFEFHDLPLP